MSQIVKIMKLRSFLSKQTTVPLVGAEGDKCRWRKISFIVCFVALLHLIKLVEPPKQRKGPRAGLAKNKQLKNRMERFRVMTRKRLLWGSHQKVAHKKGEKQTTKNPEEKHTSKEPG